MLNGAQALIRTLIDAGVETCFANPGTSEIHFVAAVDSMPEMRMVLTLFEGVATGAADGYARMAGTPAATLLHLGPGVGYGLPNLHNARRAKSPVVNIVGAHATYHARHDPPLQSDIETIARNVSTWVRTSRNSEELARDAVEAIAAATGPPGQVATLIVPADISWEEGVVPAPLPQPVAPPAVSAEVIEAVASALRGSRRTGILLGGRALRERGLIAAARIAAATGTKLFAERSTPRLERGAGLPAVERLAYWPELASAQLDGLEQLILADAQPPVAWFAYSRREKLAGARRVRGARALAADVRRAQKPRGAGRGAGCCGRHAQRCSPGSCPARPEGPLTAEKVCQAIGAILPEGAIISDEAITSAAALPASTAGSPRHDWLTLTGGAIGQGLPVAVGAATACPDRPVIALEADGSALYTIQSLWTMAREQLDVTVVIFNNRGYEILDAELARLDGQSVGDEGQGAARAWGIRTSISSSSAAGSGSPRGVSTLPSSSSTRSRRPRRSGPHLIEAVLPAVSRSR